MIRSRPSRAVLCFLDAFGLRPEQPGRSELRELARSFSHLPYENATKWLRRAGGGPARDWLRGPDTVIRDHLELGAGGTCFSLSHCLIRILRESGYQAFPVMADMRRGTDQHCCVMVRLEGRSLLLDPGYLMRSPLEIPTRGVQESAGVRLMRGSRRGRDVVDCSTLEHGQVKWRYRVKLEPVRERVFLEHWERSFEKLGSLVVASSREDARLYLHGRFLRETDRTGHRNHRVPRRGYARGVQRWFGLESSLVEAALEAWKRHREDG